MSKRTPATMASSGRADKRPRLGGGDEDQGMDGEDADAPIVIDDEEEEADAPPPEPVASAVDRALFAFHRAMTTELLFNAIRPGNGTLRRRIDAYCEALHEDAVREESLIDMNQQDRADGNTFLMKAILLFGDVCANNRTQNESTVNFKSMDGPADTTNATLMALMDTMDVRIKNHAGYDVLNFLFNHVVVNAQSYFDWWVVTKLMNLGAPLESRSPKGETPLLRAAASGSTPNVVQLLIEHGADMGATTPNGNTMWHALVRTCNLRVLQPLVLDGSLAKDFSAFFVANTNGHTPMDLAMELRTHSPFSREIYGIADAICAQWAAYLGPCIEKEVKIRIGVPGLASIVRQYIDGFGRPWPPVDEPPLTSSPVAASDAVSLDAPAPMPIPPTVHLNPAGDPDGGEEDEHDENFADDLLLGENEDAPPGPFT